MRYVKSSRYNKKWYSTASSLVAFIWYVIRCYKLITIQLFGPCQTWEFV